MQLYASWMTRLLPVPPLRQNGAIQWRYGKHDSGPSGLTSIQA